MGKWLLPKIEGVCPGARGGHASVSVGSRVLVFGGSDRAPVTYDDLWVLETANGNFEWTRISPIMANGCTVHPRSGASLTAVGDQVYLFGGQEPVTEFRFGDMKVLDTNTWTWSDVQVEGSSPPPRHSHTAGCLAGQCILLYGGSGYQGTMADVWVFNTLTKAWTRPVVSGSHPAGREMHSASMVGPHTMLVFGGRAADGRVLCDAAVLDAKAMRWAAGEPTPFSRCAHSSVPVPALGAGAAAGAGAAGASGSAAQGGSGSGGGSSPVWAPEEEVGAVLVYGGFSGGSVEGDVLRIDGKSLDVELVRRGPRETDAPGSVPPARFAHTAVAVPWAGAAAAAQGAHAGAGSGEGAAAAAGAASGGQQQAAGQVAMVVFGGVNPAEDLADVAIWVDG